MSQSNRRFSPLDAEHRMLEAKMTPFGGWDMPLAYPSGTLAEHAACRTSAAIFDVSHLGTVRVEGAEAFELLQRTLTNDLSKIAPGRAQYTHLLNPDDASVVDDIIVWWISENVFDVMPNASNTDGVVAAIGGTDTTADRAVIAIQGPTARTVVSVLSVEASQVARFHVAELDVCGFPCVIAGTGYTGEDGLEIAVPRDGAATIWKALLAAGAIPAGLGARDTLRLEAALPLHGHELGEGISPLQANLNWVVAWNKPDFIGKAALEIERSRGVSRALYGISIPGRRPARDGTIVRDKNSVEIGIITSGNFSPTLGYCVALALLKPETKLHDAVQLDVRGTILQGVVCSTPFVEKKK